MLLAVTRGIAALITETRPLSTRGMRAAPDFDVNPAVLSMLFAVYRRLVALDVEVCTLHAGGMQAEFHCHQLYRLR